MSNSVSCAVILAGGQGKRMKSNKWTQKVVTNLKPPDIGSVSRFLGVFSK